MKICKRCIMDETANNFFLDEHGFCNYCNEFYAKNIISNTDNSKIQINFQNLINKIKKSKNKYDCVVGISGGVDSSWVLVNAIKLGLKPLAVHMDNSWNSELAQNNIENLVKKLDVDLYTYVIDWNEYREMMEAFFASNVIDIELLYDNAMYAVNYKLAKKFNCKFILSGHNASTEGMKIPEEWNWFKYDKRQIYDIVKKFSKIKINTFPSIGVLDYAKYRFLNNILQINLLDYMSYNKEFALEELEKNYGYKRYPYKHYESIFTRFYQGYILIEKFNVDKRKVHLSNLICTNQLSRTKALEMLNKTKYGYENKLDLKEDIDYFLKKMKWDFNKLKSYLEAERVNHHEFKTEKNLYKNLSYFYKFFKR